MFKRLLVLEMVDIFSIFIVKYENRETKKKINNQNTDLN